MSIYVSSHAKRSRRRWPKVVLGVGLTLALLTGVGITGLWLYGRSLNNNLDRVDAITTDQSQQPRETGAFNLLIVGSDSRDPASTEDSRTDTIMLAHVNEARDHVYLSSIARDTWVPVPGHGNAKINAAYAWGGASLLVQTVQNYTGVAVDHFVMIDFAGFESVVDTLGGVDMTVEKTVTSIHAPYRVFTEGAHSFTGAEALDWVRQRYQFADGDFSRQKHQQQLITAVIDRATEAGILTDPARLNGFLQAVTSAVTVDRGFDLMKTAIALRDLRSNDMTYLTSPHKGVSTIDGQSVVLPDPVKARELYATFVNDTVAQYLATASPSPVASTS
ncbi:LCP family protein [Catelliglobosispora koreensis]|uniref:LCP family protein n=1 Tax=Catelliglobosispora koreensis TaxID=129052 RepID=UPI00036C76F1|nr:LCP family protein [Catelliglobosispora koreensis]